MPAAMPAEKAADHGSHAGHQHGALDPDADRRRLGFVFVLILAFMAGEVVVGILAHSLALLSDAGHMLTDAGAIALSLVAVHLAARRPEGGMTFGLKRADDTDRAILIAEVARLSRLTEALLTLARLDAGESPAAVKRSLRMPRGRPYPGQIRIPWKPSALRRTQLRY